MEVIVSTPLNHVLCWSTCHLTIFTFHLSITIPDVTIVLDSGRVREVRRNRRTSTSILVTDWCAKSSAKQRAGRAGRVQPGLSLKLYSSATAEHVMKATSEPELRRVPLEEICLSILASGFARSCHDFLEKAPQPPPRDSVQAALDILYDVGAIMIDNKSECLTSLGSHLARLPLGKYYFIMHYSQTRFLVTF